MPKKDQSNSPRTRTSRARLTGSGSISVGRDAVGSVLTTGGHSRIDAQIHASNTQISLPPSSSVNPKKEIEEIRQILQDVGGDAKQKIARALEDAAEEVHKPAPDKNEVGSALKRALDYAKQGTDFTSTVIKLAPHVTNAVAWLGSNWHHLLGVVGLTL